MQTTREFQLYGPCTPESKQREPKNLWARSAFWSLAAVGMFLFVAVAGCREKPAPTKPAPPAVEVTEVIQQNVPNYTDWISQLSGPVNADITPKVQGYLLKQNYQNGYFVKKN